MLRRFTTAVAAVGLSLVLVPEARAADAEPADPEPAASHPDDPATGPGTRSAAQERMEAIAAELRQIAERHGPDAVVFQTKLLINALSQKPLGPTEVRVAGASGPTTGAAPDGAPSYLRFEVASGLVFDAAATTPSQRLARIWQSMVLPTLAGMGSFKLEPRNLEVELGFGVQDIETLGLAELDPREAMVEESVAFRVPAAVLDDLIYDLVAGDAVFERCEARYGERRVHTLDAEPVR